MNTISYIPFCIVEQLESLQANELHNRVKSAVRNSIHEHAYYDDFTDEFRDEESSFEDLETMDIYELRDKYLDYWEEPDFKKIVQVIEDDLGYSYEEWKEDCRREQNYERDREEAQLQQRTIQNGIEYEKDYFSSLVRTKPYAGNGSGLVGSRKSCIIMLPIDYYSDQKFIETEVRFNPKDFPSGTRFVRLIFSHVFNENGELVTGIEIPGTNKTIPVSFNENGQYNIEIKSRKILTSKFKKQGLDSIIYFINKFAMLYHKYPNQDTIMFMKAYAFNSNFYNDELPIEFYYQLGDDENEIKRHFR